MRGVQNLTLVAGLALTAAAFAQPISTDLGVLNIPGTMNAGGTIGVAGEVDWYRFTITTAVRMDDLTFLDINTNGSTIDTEIGVYSSTGAMVSIDDDDAEGTLSALSFGSGSATFAGTGGVVSNGRDGQLLPGTYYLAVARWNAEFGNSNWSVIGGTDVGGSYSVSIGAGTASAPAEPAGVVDLGAMNVPQTVQVTDAPLAAGQVRWYKLRVPSVSVAQDRFLDLDTEGSLLLPDLNNTRLVVYGRNGALVVQDDNDGTGLTSQVSFGASTPARPAPDDGRAYDGRDGALQEGVYYIGIGGPGTAPSTVNTATGVNFNFTSGAANAGTVSLKAVTGGVTPPPTDPMGVGNATGCVVTSTGGNLSLRVSVTPGTNPASTGLGVIVDASDLELGTITLLDNGVDDDGIAGNNIFGKNVVVPPGIGANIYNLPFDVIDAQGRDGAASLVVYVNNDDFTGELLSSATDVTAGTTQLMVSLSANKTQLLRIEICDPANFQVTTSSQIATDTQLFLFDSNGRGVVMNDDHPVLGGPYSRLTNAFVTQPGTYYLAVGAYNRDPWTGQPCNNNLIWNNIPFSTERAPDGPGRAGILQGWSGVTAASNIDVAISGLSCGCVVTCDFNQDGGADTSDVLELADSVAAGTDPYPGSCRDFNQDGGADTSDILDLADAIASGTCP